MTTAEEFALFMLGLSSLAANIGLMIHLWGHRRGRQ